MVGSRFDSPPSSVRTMNLSPNQILIVETAEVLPMFTAELMALFLTDGTRDRLRAVEYNLPRLTKKKKALIRVRNGRYGYVYKLKGRGGLQKEKIYHDLTSTKAAIRFQASEVVNWYGERFFKQARLYPMPEWAAQYNGFIYLFEFSTENNFKRTDLMRKKIKNYRESHKRMKEFFMADPITIFVFDVPKSRVEKFAKQQPYDQFYYTDLGSFETVKKGKQFQAPIYIWGGNGKYYSLFK
jgi:hypothetical protein